MYLVNKYTVWYNSIIDKAKRRTSKLEYKEKHHIIPKSLGGSNGKDNIVVLTAREHFICHILLPKMVLGQNMHKMLQAAWMMTVACRGHCRFTVSNRRYEQLRIAMSAIKKDKSTWNKGVAPSDDTRLKLRAATLASLVRQGKLTQDDADHRNSLPLGTRIKKVKKSKDANLEKQRSSSGWKWSDEARAKLAAQRLGKRHPHVYRKSVAL